MHEELKIYIICDSGEHFYICHYSAIEAYKFYFDIMPAAEKENVDTVFEFPKNKWKEERFYPSWDESFEDKTMTYYDFMLKQQQPKYFATSLN